MGNCSSMRVLAVAAYAAVWSCGGAMLGDVGGTAPALDDGDQSARCKVVKDASRPLLVEWPATDKAALQVQSAQGIAVVRYDGCRLKLLTGCLAPGSYALVETSRARDGFSVGSIVGTTRIKAISLMFSSGRGARPSLLPREPGY